MAIDLNDIPADIQQHIREFAQREWPSDFVMQAHVVEQQANAYRHMSKPSVSGLPENVLSQIQAKAATEWPNDFVMRAHTIEQQMAAYKQLYG